MPMLDLPNIKIEDRHRYCRVTMRPSFDDAGYFVDFTPEETRQIEAALHEYNQRQKP